MKLSILDGYSIVQKDLNWDRLKTFGEIDNHPICKEDKVSEYIHNADIILTSKSSITREHMEKEKSLKLIHVLATGYDNIDIKAAKELGIAVTNTPNYSTRAVAQHVFALILEITNQAGLHNQKVKSGKWQKSELFTFWETSLSQLDGKSIGIVGHGNIGKEVEKIAKAFNMEVNIYSKDREKAIKSDILTLHCPLTKENKGFINKDFIEHMKDGAILINTARGGLLDEEAVSKALKSKKLSFAALDVLSKEPPKYNPLINLENTIITPHIAWIPKEAREAIIDITYKNIESFLNGEELNRIV